MRITTWNINSIRARLHRLPEWLDSRRPDVLCLQETKCQDKEFPRELFEERGYHLALFGQKTYNGVAIASLQPLEDVRMGFPLEDDPDARGIAATTGGLRVVNVYVVNGRSVGHERYNHKLRWLDALVEHVAEDAKSDRPFVLCGDFNIAPTDEDTWDPAYWNGKILCSEPEREPYRRLLGLGLIDSFRTKYPQKWGRYAHTWWDFRSNGFQRGWGLRIDHLLVNPPLYARTTGVVIDREARKGEKPSDHAPVTLYVDEPAPESEG